MTTKTVGQFTYANGQLSGPAEYMREQGNARVDSILAGTDVLFNMGREFQPDSVTLLLVTLQTDYAGWKGTRELLAGLGR